MQLPPSLPLFQLHVLGESAHLNYINECSCDSALIDRYGLVGLFRPLTVYPSEMVYWGVSLSDHFSSKK
jgi:hypothetical protein